MNLSKHTLFFISLSVILIFNVPANSQDTSPDTSNLLDMTYSFDENTIYWPTAEPFKLEKLNWGMVSGEVS